MNKKTAKRLKRRLATLRTRRANLKFRDLASIAEALGRVMDPRGKEPTFVSELLRNRPPITIPNHPRGVAPFTAISILDALELDILALEEMIEAEEDE
jgi:hypothetical protein